MGTIARMQAAVSALPDGPVKRDLQRAVTEVIELREAAYEQHGFRAVNWFDRSLQEARVYDRMAAALKALSE